MIKRKKLAKCKEIISITENQSEVIFKLIDQSNIGIRSTSHATKEKLGGKKTN
jgi:hypothetical protein